MSLPPIQQNHSSKTPLPNEKDSSKQQWNPLKKHNDPPINVSIKQQQLDRNTLHKHKETEIRAHWISSEGKFATDNFIAQLLQSKAPKTMHDQLRLANFQYADESGKKTSSTARPVSQTTSKSKSSKTTISEEVIKEHFPKALPLPLITKGFIEFLEEEMLFSPRQTMHCNSCCAGDAPLVFAAPKECFLARHIPIGGICGLPLHHSAQVTAKRASLYGCKLVVTYQSHCSVSANGTFDYIELSDKGTDLRIETQCCQPGIECLNKILFATKLKERITSSTSAAFDSPKKPTVSVKMSEPLSLPAPINQEEALLNALLLKHEQKIFQTKNPPLIELPQILYKEIRNSTLTAMVPLLDVPTLFIGAIHIHTPPEIADYYHVINVDLLRSKAVRNRQSKTEEDSSGGKSGNEVGDAVPTPRSVYDSEEEDSEEEEEGNKESNEEELNEIDPFEEIDCHLPQFYKSISKRIIAFEASKRGKLAVKQGIETATDRRLKRKKQKEQEANIAEKKRNDDWNIEEKTDREDGTPTTVAEKKMGKWFIFFRWSRIVRRMVEVVKRSETEDDWNLGEGVEGEEKTKKKMGALFMTLRWNRLVKRVLHVHKRKEKREELHYY